MNNALFYGKMGDYNINVTWFELYGIIHYYDINFHFEFFDLPKQNGKR